MVTTLQKLQNYLKEIEKNDKNGKKINAFLELRNEKDLIAEAKIIDEKIKNKTAGRLAGKIIGIKANINVLGLHASCASKCLENYKSPYDAFVVEKIKKQDGLIIGMLNMDEFASGSSGETSAFGPTKNPVALGKITGGSSSGPAAAVAGNFCDMALGSDTGGSIRNPASHCGIVGIKPTYSVVSRYGLIDLAMSTDTIGPLAKNVYDATLLLDVIKEKDEKDAISQESKRIDFKKLEQTPKEIVVGILDISGLKVDERIKKLIEEKINLVVKKNNWKTKKIKIENLDLAIETYYPIVYVEVFSGTRKLDGRRFGKKIEDSCGPEFLRRILGGSEISKAEHSGRYYHLALKSKKLIEQEFKMAFKEVDCIICPTVPILPHNIGEKISVEEMYAYDALTIPSSLAGNCCISIPAGKIQNIPVGLQIMCDKFQEQKMLEIAREIERGN